jgi:hypothetical protein
VVHLMHVAALHLPVQLLLLQLLLLERVAAL